MIPLKYLKNKYRDLVELKQHYLTLTKIHHPDKGGDEQEFKDMAKEYEFMTELFGRDIMEFKLMRHFKEIKGKHKVAYLDEVQGSGTFQDPFIGNVSSKYYKDWLIYFKHNQKNHQSHAKINNQNHRN